MCVNAISRRLLLCWLSLLIRIVDRAGDIWSEKGWPSVRTKDLVCSIILLTSDLCLYRLGWPSQ
jgi:hypothetical protein